MLSQANIEWMSQVSGVSVDDISGALSNEEEVTLDFRVNGKIVSQDDEKAIRESAIQQGKELRSKELAKELGVTLDAGEKDPDKIAEKFKSSVTTTLEDKYKNRQPSEELVDAISKVKDWENKYNKLTETYQNTQQSVNEWQKKYSGLEQKIIDDEINNHIIQSFPEKMSIDKTDALLIVKNKFKFERNDDSILARSGDNYVQDSLGNPEKLDAVVKSFVEEKGWIKGSGKNGGDSKKGGAPKGFSPEQAQKYIEDKGVIPTSQEGLKMFRELTAK